MAERKQVKKNVTKKSNRKVTSKKTTRKRKTKDEIRSEMCKYLNLLASNPELKGGLEKVQLETKYRHLFIERFGLEKIPTIEAFNEFKNNLLTISNEVQSN